MRKYIEQLTDDLIGKCHFDVTADLLTDREEFLRHAKVRLECGPVFKMKPDTLGKIMCALEVGDVMATKKDIFEHVSFSGDCEDLQRELVAVCLAYAIRDRLEGVPNVPPHRSVENRQLTPANFGFGDD